MRDSLNELMRGARASSEFKVPSSQLRSQRYPHNPRLNENYQTKPLRNPRAEIRQKCFTVRCL
jgi:hypothetical protein